LAAAVLLPLLGMTGLVWRQRGRFAARRGPGLLLCATLFFVLCMGLLLCSADWLPQAWLRLLVGIDIVSLGVIMVARDAFDQGGALAPAVVRSLDYAAFYALLFGGQVGLAMVFATGATLAMQALLLA